MASPPTKQMHFMSWFYNGAWHLLKPTHAVVQARAQSESDWATLTMHMWRSTSPVTCEAAVVVEDHHRALLAWSQYRSRLAAAPRLITLDHHTDTSRPFRHHLRTAYAPAEHERLRAAWLADIDFRHADTVVAAIGRLNNDEHIVTALATDIISSAFVVAHNAKDTDLPTYREHKIMCRSASKNQDSYDVSREDCDKVAESRFLEEMLSSFREALATTTEPALLQGPYILDIDLDYFNTLASVAPQDATVLRDLATGAGLVTIATEPRHVKACALDPNLTSDDLLPKVLALLGCQRSQLEDKV